jgi:hypothetical protein
MKDETLHAVEMTREIRDRMYEETKGFRDDELIRYFNDKGRSLGQAEPLHGKSSPKKV